VAEKRVANVQPNAISRYFRETTGELRKVNWPTRQEATNLTLIVLVVITTMALFLGTLDLLFSYIMRLLVA
jgi:preprotein translocase subunit SecE